ncbi:MAG: hypothetical protein FGM14_08515 [Flavobacteriales bacterium]|nr:hypothetical protein [Flavobacteriales bacterium]
MSANSLKSSIMKNVAGIEDVQLLKHINSLLVKSKKEVLVNIPSEQEQEINQAREQFKAGECSTQESIEKRFSRWKN